MSLVRRHLRRSVVAWLACHALTFTALVPRDCCAAHAHAVASSPDGAAAAVDAPCHEMAAGTPAPPPVSDDHCDMPASDGSTCPMHRAGASPAACAMTGLCHAPDAALASVLWQAALAPSAPHLVTPVAALAPRAAIAAPSIALAVPPDSPPPRS